MNQTKKLEIVTMDLKKNNFSKEKGKLETSAGIRQTCLQTDRQSHLLLKYIVRGLNMLFKGYLFLQIIS